MLERAKQIQKVIDQKPDLVHRLEQLIEEIELLTYRELSNDKIMTRTIKEFATEVDMGLDLIDISGLMWDGLPTEEKRETVDKFGVYCQGNFGPWLQKTTSEGNKETQRIIRQKALKRFIEKTQIISGLTQRTGAPINLTKLNRAHELYLRGHKRQDDQQYKILRTSLRVSTVEVFFEQSLKIY